MHMDIDKSIWYQYRIIIHWNLIGVFHLLILWLQISEIIQSNMPLYKMLTMNDEWKLLIKYVPT